MDGLEAPKVIKGLVFPLYMPNFSSEHNFFFPEFFFIGQRFVVYLCIYMFFARNLHIRLDFFLRFGSISGVITQKYVFIYVNLLHNITMYILIVQC